MIKKLDSYIFTKFLSTLVMTSAAFLVIFFIVDLVENLRKILDSDAPASTAAIFSLLNLPWLFNISLPIAVLLASVITFATLVKHNELVSIKSAGVSLYRLVVPMIILGLVISIFSFYFGEIVVIKSSRKRFDIARKYSLKGAKRVALRKFNINFQEGKNRNISIGVYKFRDMKGERVNIQYFKNESLFQRLDAAEMIWNEEKSKWIFKNVILRRFDDEKELVFTSDIVDTINIRLTPAGLKVENRKPEEMSYWELEKFVRNLEANGIDARNWRINHLFKISLSFTNFVIILIGIPMAVGRVNGGIAFGVGMALLTSFIFYGFIKFGQTLAKQGILDPVVGVWLGNGIFLILSIALIIKSRK